MTPKHQEIYNILNNEFPNLKCFLNYNTAFQLLCAVMLSAQTTDKRVNEITPILFDKYKTPIDLMNANLKDVKEIIKPLGLAEIKAKNLISLSHDFVIKYNSIMPNTIKELTSLSGVGIKTANVVLAEIYKIPSIAVDTHVYRVSLRLGLRKESDSLLDCENKLKKKFDKELWINLHHLLIIFGRTYCKAAKPNCLNCILKDYCKYKEK